MAIRNLSQVYCSLNLGLVYSVNYSWSPKEGASIDAYFVKQDGNYQRPQYMQKAQIRIGNASLSLYVVSSSIQLSSGRRVMKVTFVDEVFQLENYLVVQTGRGCGFNVFPLGIPVDDRSVQEKISASLDPQAQQIADLTQHPDVEYVFNDFLNILRQKFNVSVGAYYNPTIASTEIWGTFREVLDGWCNLFNFSWFFENGILKIYDPTKLFLTLPEQPANAIEFESDEDVRDTYSKTVFNWYQQDGGEYPVNQAGDPSAPPSNGQSPQNSNGPLLLRSVTLYPLGYEQGLQSTSISLEQVAAAYYGEKFWILYNYYKGTLSQCGWTITNPDLDATIFTSANRIGAKIVSVNTEEQQQRFEAYQFYGERIAGRYYLSNARSDVASDETYSWFEEATGQVFNPAASPNKNVRIEAVVSTNSSSSIIPNTSINKYFPGIRYTGDRLIYQDSYPRNLPALTSGQYNQINRVYDEFIVDGSEMANYSALSAGNYQMYIPLNIPAEIRDLFDQILTTAELFKPRFDSFPIKGAKSSDYANTREIAQEQSSINVVKTSPGPNIIGNTAVIKTVKDGVYRAYYGKYSKCASEYSTSPFVFRHRFFPNQISTDTPVGVTFKKTAANTYIIQQNYSSVNNLVNNPFLPLMAQAKTTLSKRVSFTVNYFYDIPLNYLTNGLVGLSISVGDRGITASYTFSNDILMVPDYSNDFTLYQQNIKNSFFRSSKPNFVVS